MPFELNLDSGLIIIMAAFDLYLITRFFQFRKQLLVRGTVPSRLFMLIIICGVVVVQACRGMFTQYTLAFNLVVVLAVALIAVTPSGISKDGMLSGVLPTVWSKMYYFEFEPYSDKKVRLRAHLATTERSLLFDKEKQPQVEAHLLANNVMTFAKYKELYKAKQQSKGKDKK